MEIIMKIGVSMDINSPYNLWGDDFYKKVKEIGADCVDYQSMAPDSSFVFTKSTKEAEAVLLKEKKLAEESGIVISQMHAPWRFPPQDGTVQERADRLEQMKKTLWGCSVLGCKNWIVHAIMPFGIEDLGTEFEKQTYELNLEFMSALLSEAKKYGITINIENLPFTEFSLSSPVQVLKLADDINDDNFKICIDTGHAEAFYGRKVGDAVRLVGGKLNTFHIHDSKYGKDLHMFPYFGVIDWDDFAKSLGDVGYKGVFSMETLPPYTIPVELYTQLCADLVKIAKLVIDKI